MGKRIFVGNLPWSVTFEKLKELFEPYGEIEDAIVVSDKYTGRSRGFGFVTFKEESSAQRAIAEMNQKSVEGREIKVTEATPLKKREKEEPAEPEKTEEKPAKDLKEEASESSETATSQ